MSSGDSKVAIILNKLGYTNTLRITSTLQGSIWKATKQIVGANNVIISLNIVVKITNIHLHANSKSTVINRKQYKIDENILNEITILKYLTHDNIAPKSIIKYIDCFRRYFLYFCILALQPNPLYIDIYTILQL